MVAMLLQPYAESDTGISPVPIIFFGLVACVFSLQFWLRRRRRHLMVALAEKRHLHWLDNVLPDNFPDDELLADLGSWWSLGGWSGTYNVIGGMDGGDYLLAFDIRIGWGRNEYRQTVVAMKSHEARRTPINRGGSVYRDARGWRALIPSRGFSDIRSPEVIEGLWQALR